MNWLEKDQHYIMSTYQRLPIVVEKGEGNYLYDSEQNKYLDLFTGLAVNIVGHSHPYLLDKLKEQADQFLHISNMFINKPAVRLAERLIELSIPGKVFFANSGAEATEAAVKLVHKWGSSQEIPKKGIAVLEKSFHGRTLGVIQLTRQPGIYQDFPAADYPVYEVEAENLEALEEVLKTKQPAAFLFEPVLGSGGIQPVSPSFMEKAKALCEKYNVLFIVDEIQTGIGRTGTFFAYERADITPDVILFAKGIGGGLPLGGMIAGEHVQEVFHPGDHGTTFGPSPLSAAMGNAVLDVLYDQNELENGRKRSEYLWSRLEDWKNESEGFVQEIRGLGMMIGVVLEADASFVKALQERLLAKGFMFNITQQRIIRLLPPLTLERAEVDSFIETLAQEMNALKERSVQ
ncbi:aspartate aminotransferase family protein [Marinococcus luteus]|uniref:aspartate aminotransferase family protein n=1 Tax=Marinococcus luteus TaxID=1122204 RepID=UPI002ACC59BB|nr:acetylornithine transaminase [Marinococcus luteus]MDZ5781662.1 acetylornithine transaminase [Marinococcus luteus]